MPEGYLTTNIFFGILHCMAESAMAWFSKGPLRFCNVYFSLYTTHR